MSRQRTLPNSPVFQLDNLTPEERQKLAVKIKNLNGTYLGREEFEKQTTHIACDVIKLSEKFLGACVKGLWVVTTQYVTDSYHAGQWLDEKDYEHSMRDPRQELELVSAYKRWRWKVTRFKEPPFIEWKVALLVETAKMATFKRLLTYGGAKIIALSLPLCEHRPTPDVTYVIVDSSHKELAAGVQDFGLMCLDQKFVIDTIIKDEVLDPFNYLVSSEMSENFGFALEDQPHAPINQSENRFDASDNQLSTSDRGSDNKSFNAEQFEMDVSHSDKPVLDIFDDDLPDIADREMGLPRYSIDKHSNDVSKCSVSNNNHRPLDIGPQNGLPSSRDVDVSNKFMEKGRKHNSSSIQSVMLHKSDTLNGSKLDLTVWKRMLSEGCGRDDLSQLNRREVSQTQITDGHQPSPRGDTRIVTKGLNDQNMDRFERRFPPLDIRRQKIKPQVKPLDPNVSVDEKQRKTNDSKVTECKRKLFHNDSTSNSLSQLKMDRVANTLNKGCSSKISSTFHEKTTSGKRPHHSNKHGDDLLTYTRNVSNSPKSSCISATRGKQVSEKHSKNHFSLRNAADLGCMQKRMKNDVKADPLCAKKSETNTENELMPVNVCHQLPVNVHLYGLQENAEQDKYDSMLDARMELPNSATLINNSDNENQAKSQRNNAYSDISSVEGDSKVGPSSPTMLPTLKLSLSPSIYPHPASSLQRKKTSNKKHVKKKEIQAKACKEISETSQSTKPSKTYSSGGITKLTSTPLKKSFRRKVTHTKVSVLSKPSNKSKLTWAGKSSPSSSPTSSSSRPLESTSFSHVQTNLSSFGFVSSTRKAYKHSKPGHSGKSGMHHTGSSHAGKRTKRGLAKIGSNNRNSSNNSLDSEILIKKGIDSSPDGSPACNTHLCGSERAHISTTDSDQNVVTAGASTSAAISKEGLLMENVPLSSNDCDDRRQAVETMSFEKNEIEIQKDSVSGEEDDMQSEMAFPKVGTQKLATGKSCSDAIVITDDESDGELLALANEMEDLENTLENHVRELQISRAPDDLLDAGRASDKEACSQSSLKENEIGRPRVSTVDFNTSEHGSDAEGDLGAYMPSLEKETQDVNIKETQGVCEGLLESGTGILNKEDSSNMNLCEIATMSSSTRSELCCERETHVGDGSVLKSDLQKDQSNVNSSTEVVGNSQRNNPCPISFLEWPLSLPLCMNPTEYSDKNSLPVIFGQWMEADIEMGFSHSAVIHGKPCLRNRPTSLLLSEMMTLVKNEDTLIRAEAFNCLMSWLELHPPVKPSTIKLYCETFQLGSYPSLYVFNVISDIISESGDINLGAVMLLEYFVSVLEINFDHCLKMGDKASLKESLIVKLLWKDPFEVYHCSKLCHKLIKIFGKAVTQPQPNFRVCTALCSVIALAAECMRICNNKWSPYSPKFISESVLNLAADVSRKISSQRKKTMLTLLHLLRSAWFRALVTAMTLSSYNTYLLLGDIDIRSLSLSSITSQFFFLVPPCQPSSESPSLRTRKEEPMQENISPDTFQRQGSFDLSVNSCSSVNDFTQKREKNAASRVNKRNHKGESPLHIACIKNKALKVKEILSVPGVDVNMRDNSEWTPLHEACLHGSYDCVKLLLEYIPATSTSGEIEHKKRKVEINAIGDEGRTPLHDAVLYNHVDICRLLLSYGGPKLLSSKTTLNKTAMDLAETEEMKNALTAFSVNQFDSLSGNDSFTDCQSSQGLTNNTSSHVVETRPLPLLYKELLGTGKRLVVSQEECSHFLSLLALLVTSYYSTIDFTVQVGSLLDAQDSKVLTNMETHLKQLRKHVKNITKKEDYEAMQLQTDLTLMEIVCLSKKET